MGVATDHVKTSFRTAKGTVWVVVKIPSLAVTLATVGEISVVGTPEKVMLFEFDVTVIPPCVKPDVEKVIG
jgi:hypothetical protein